MTHTHRYATIIISEEKIMNLRERGKEHRRSWKGVRAAWRFYIAVCYMKFSKTELKKEHMLKELINTASPHSS